MNIIMNETNLNQFELIGSHFFNKVHVTESNYMNIIMNETNLI